MTTKNKPVYWSSVPPINCEICDSPITNIFYDAKTIMGSWANMCEKCFKYGPGINKLALGSGQKYEKQLNGDWLKTKS